MGIWSAIVPAAASIIGGVLGIGGNKKDREQQEKLNRQDREFQREMWNASNVYNAPDAQMQRLKTAGLNPNLVYGNGASAGTAANFGLPQSRPLPPRNSGEIIGSTINQVASLSLQDLQKDAIQTQMLKDTQQIAESAMRTEKGRTVDTNKVIADTNLSKQKRFESLSNTSLLDVKGQREAFELGKGETLLSTTVQQAEANVRNMQLKNVEQEINNSNLPEKNKVAIFEAYSRLKLQQANMSQQQIDTALKDEILQMRRKGIEVSDSMLLRWFSDLMPSKSEIKESFKDEKAFKHNTVMDLIRFMTGSKKK